MNNIPRNEYPRPQFVRPGDSWINLNGEWEFELDLSASGHQRWMHTDRVQYTKKITVPFVPESKLSGIEYTDYIPACWYRRSIDVPAGFDPAKERLILHFGACNYKTTVYFNEEDIFTHVGGYTPFEIDLTDKLKAENVLTLWVTSDVRSGTQPSGKQCSNYSNYGCFYTRSTGIWQTVWLERVPRTYIKKAYLTPDLPNEKVDIRLTVAGDMTADSVTAEVTYRGEAVASVTAKVNGRSATFSVPVKNPKIWDVGKPELYDVRFTMGEDKLDSYFGMRSIEVKGKVLALNGRPVFQRLVLDQGYYRDGIYTAPTDDDLRRDIELSMAAGFNGARLHQKIFEPRFHYHADHLGYITWGEYPSWGLDVNSDRAMNAMLPEWLEELDRDYSAPSIIGWCPLNETGPGRCEAFFRMLYEMTHALDPFRPVIDTSGYFHTVTDVYDVHNYEQDPERFAALFDPMREDMSKCYKNFGDKEKYEGQPYFVSEYGGTSISLDKNDTSVSWGYGTNPKSVEDFYVRLEGLTDALVSNPNICAYCYTQLTDVFQEQNGIFTFDREAKFDLDRVKAIFGKKAAIEE